MRYRMGCWLLGLVVMIGAVAAAPAPAGASTSSDLALLKTYEPVLIYPSQEYWRPMPAGSFTPGTTLQQYQGGWKTLLADPSATQLPAGSCAASSAGKSTWAGCDRMNINLCDYGGAFTTTPLSEDTCYLSHAPAAAKLADTGPPTDAVSTVYGRAYHNPTPSTTGIATVLQYWLLYEVNDYRNSLNASTVTAMDLHEGDWETVQVMLSTTGTPVELAYSQHSGGGRRLWAKVPKYPGTTTHPEVWVAAGSHSEYPAAGTWPVLTALGMTFYDHTAPATGWTWGLGPALIRPTMPLAIAQVTGSGTTISPSWLGYAGAWGKDEWIAYKSSGAWQQLNCMSNSDLLAPYISCTGPQGPAQHAIWKQPVTTALGWPIE